MAMACTICNHPNRLEIDREIVQGHAQTMIANKYGVSWQAVRNHKENHLSKQLVTAWERKEIAEGLDLLGRIDRILERAELIFQRNYNKETYAGDDVALKALTQQRSTIELLAKISAYLHEARLAELKNNQDRFEEDRQADYQAKLRMLTEEELVMLAYLQHRMQGDEVPDHLTPAVFKAQEVKPTNKPTPRPALKTPPKTNLKADTSDDLIDPIEAQPPQEPEAPKLPPAPAKVIPGSENMSRRGFRTWK